MALLAIDSCNLAFTRHFLWLTRSFSMDAAESRRMALSLMRDMLTAIDNLEGDAKDSVIDTVITSLQAARDSALDECGDDDDDDRDDGAIEGYDAPCGCDGATHAHTISDTESIHTIRVHLLRQLATNPELSKQTIHFPTKGENATCTEESTITVDAFLYDDDAINDMMDSGSIPSSYCRACGSKDVEQLNIISHSMSMHQLKFMFNDILSTYITPQADAPIDSLLDVGSRLGAVLYAGYYLSTIPKLIGVELSTAHGDLQLATVSKFQLDDRVQILKDDIRNQEAAFSSASILVLNNVFEFFGDQDYRQELWMWVLSRVQPNQFLITSPSIETSLEAAELDCDVMQHVTPIPLEYPSPVVDDDEYAEDARSLFLYKVTSPFKT
eukprot:m.185899 g.185899  ORF g.185899 m.185899 type:complete len:384 (-) comp14742_c2_seq1:176-1327(-)